MMLLNILLFSLTLSALKAESVKKCTCSEGSVSDIFCQSDFVIGFKVEDVARLEYLSRDVYQVKISDIYKATDEARGVLKANLVTSYSVDGMCGTTLGRNYEETIGGRIIDGQPVINACHSILLNSDAINLRDFIPKNCSVSSSATAR